MPNRTQQAKHGTRKAVRDNNKASTAQETIPYEVMWPDGLCRMSPKRYSKSILFEDINYQLAGKDDQEAAFGKFKDYYNFFDASVDIQLSLLSHFADRESWIKSINIESQSDEFDETREEYEEMLENKLEYGSNGLQKTKLYTLSIEADNEKQARSKLSRLELDAINHLKLMGVFTQVLNGRERLNILHDAMHPDGEKFQFDWKQVTQGGLSTKDFIAPSSFSFGNSKYFTMGSKVGQCSFLQILAPELTDRILSDFMEAEEGISINLHIKPVDQAHALKTVKRKITDLDAMKIQEQKRASRDGYDINIIPSDLMAFGGDVKGLLEDLSNRNEKMFLVTIINNVLEI